ncbi:hypothetical protein Salat_2975300 [Sesamum alatum]|uniref:Uncharacterized protein n=1 Tax=Sesamum alatum TaxID=300844 RepID=A0AAE2C7N0_9LAMI|nr:hypothetical protein Salat_2975300 [Sesamum alatum]
MAGGKGSEATTAQFTSSLVWKKENGSSGISPNGLRKSWLESLEVLFLWGAKSLPDSLLFEGKAPVAKQGSEREKRKRSFCFQFKLSPWLGDSIVGIRLANGSEFFSMHRTSTSLNEEAWP